MNRSGFRKITLLIVLSLTALAGLQIYWLARMYSDMNRRFGEKVTAAMERAAYDELVNRDKHSTHTVTNFLKAGDLDSITIHRMTGGVARMNLLAKSDSATLARLDSVRIAMSMLPNFKADTIDGTVVYRSSDLQTDTIGTTITLQGASVGRRISIINVTSTDNTLSPGDFARYDSLLSANLLQADILYPYRLSIVETESGRVISSRGGEVRKSRLFDIPIGAKKASVLRLAIENPNRGFLKEMAGLILSAVLIIVLLGVSFVYLLRTLFRQKTLEEMRTDFTHNITHELKTPIAVAFAANDALLNYGADADPDRRKKYLKIEQIQLKNLSAMVERILNMSFEEQEEYPLNRIRIPLRALLDELVETQEMKSRKPVHFTVEIAPDDLTVYGDPFQLKIIVGNLIDNALKYSGEKVEIAVTARNTGSGTEIRVSDNGIGIPPGAQEKIFEKYYRVPTGNIHTVKGFGLGLYYVRQIAARHGGTVDVASRPGKGTTFTLHIPDHGTEN